MFLPRWCQLPLFAVFVLSACLTQLQPARAHCDTLDGPVVADARQALQLGDVTPVLKWTRPDHEQEIREAFDHALAVRALGPAAAELADTYFFETLVRIHRAGEGAPYTGLKAAALTEAVAAADQALADGSIAVVEDLLLGLIRAGIEQRFAAAYQAMQRADDSVEAGREYVDAYVRYVHLIEGLEALSTASDGHGAQEAGPEPAGGQHGH